MLQENKQIISSRWKKPVLPLLFIMLFAFSQSLSLLHHHDEDLKLKVDCELCLKVGSADDAVPGSTLALKFTISAEYQSLPGSESPFLVIRSANARAPPQILVS